MQGVNDMLGIEKTKYPDRYDREQRTVGRASACFGGDVCSTVIVALRVKRQAEGVRRGDARGLGQGPWQFHVLA